MKTNTRCKILVLLLLSSVSAVMGQNHPQLSQYTFNGLYINPAYAGYHGGWNLQAVYRNEMSGVEGSPRTFTVSADGAPWKERVGVGVTITQDNLGAESNTSLYLSYAYRIPLGGRNNPRLSFGLSGGFIHSRVDMSRLSPDDVTDPALQEGNSRRFLPDARAGVFYDDDRFYAGFSATNMIVHFSKQKEDPLQQVPEKKLQLYLTGGMLLDLSEVVLLKPSFLLRDDAGGPGSVDVNVSALIKELLWVGCSYRRELNLYSKSSVGKGLERGSSLAGMLSVYIRQRLRIGYAYEHQLSQPGGMGRPGHEVSIGYIFSRQQDNGGKRRLF